MKKLVALTLALMLALSVVCFASAEDKPYAGKKLCDPEKCHVCSKVCPTHALDGERGADWHAGDIRCKVGNLDVNACSAACFGFRREVNPMCMNPVSEHPSDEELAEALKRQFAAPGFQTLDHLPMYHCERCLIYCPVGNYERDFRATGLSREAGR